LKANNSFTFLSAALILLILFSCKKDPEAKPAACMDKIPSDEMCTAYFTRWFYDSAVDSCRQIGYSGCSERGFATETECDACIGAKTDND
jgi:hypothetical protein